MLTHDLDFSAILAASGGAAPSVVRAIRQTERELSAGALLTIEPHRMRLRLLPLPAKG